MSLFVINQDEPQDASYVPDLVEVAGVQVEPHIANALEAPSRQPKRTALPWLSQRGMCPMKSSKRVTRLK